MSLHSYTPRNLLIFGATGYIGQYIVKAILKDRSAIGRIVVFTSKSSARNKVEHLQSLKSQGVEVIVGDVTQSEDIRKAYNGRYAA